MKTLAGIAALALAAGMASATTYTIDFEADALGNALAELQTIDNEYAAWGVNFVPNVLNPADGWATNTNMQVTSIDVGGGYQASYGKILHTFGGWLAEDGDPNFGMFFDQPISDLTVRFTGDFDFLSQVALYDGNGNFITSALATGTNALSSVTFTGLSNSEIAVVAPGWFLDWVGVVDVTYTFVPAPGAAAVLGFGALAMTRRRR
jgi:hypothetical protein